MRFACDGTRLHRHGAGLVPVAQSERRRSAQEIAVEFSTTLLRGLIRDEATRINDPLGVASATSLDGAR